MPVFAIPLLDKNHVFVEGNHVAVERGRVLMRYLPGEITAVVPRALIIKTRRFYEATEHERISLPLEDRLRVFTCEGALLTVLQAIDIIHEVVIDD